MKFLVLGATGRTGLLFTKEALDEGHHVTALARRVDAAIDPRARVVVGDVTDADVIAAAAHGHDAVICALGANNVSKAPTLVTDAVRAVIEASKTSGVDRFLLVSAFGVGDSLPKASFLVRPIYRTLLRTKYADKIASEQLLKSSDLNWTVAYPGALSYGDLGRYAATALDDVDKLPVFPVTSRANVADFLLRSAVDGTFSRQAVVMIDAKYRTKVVANGKTDDQASTATRSA